MLHTVMYVAFVLDIVTRKSHRRRDFWLPMLYTKVTLLGRAKGESVCVKISAQRSYDCNRVEPVG